MVMHKKHEPFDMGVHYLLGTTMWAAAGFVWLQLAFPHSLWVAMGRAGAVLMQGMWLWQVLPCTGALPTPCTLARTLCNGCCALAGRGSRAAACPSLCPCSLVAVALCPLQKAGRAAADLQAAKVLRLQIATFMFSRAPQWKYDEKPPTAAAVMMMPVVFAMLLLVNAVVLLTVWLLCQWHTSRTQQGLPQAATGAHVRPTAAAKARPARAPAVHCPFSVGCCRACRGCICWTGMLTGRGRCR